MDRLLGKPRANIAVPLNAFDVAVTRYKKAVLGVFTLNLHGLETPVWLRVENVLRTPSRPDKMKANSHGALRDFLKDSGLFSVSGVSCSEHASASAVAVK